jgi:hypothetical protein
MNPPTEDNVAASEYFDRWRLPMRLLRRDAQCRAQVAAARMRRGTGQALDVKRPGQTIPAVLAGRGAC